uniref:tRNA dimethylallyltransferase n=1 Tax=Panagrellus redivivus TaxID=6233 RepID=A0A7E4ZRT0_PANRE
MLRSVLRQLYRRIRMNDKPLIVVGGCTGTGKSDLGIQVAKKFNGEVISADSMQIYKGLDIVTNKVTDEEMDGIPHHLMSFHDPVDSKYNITRFQEAALKVMEDIWARGKLPVIVGGTAYYVEGVIYCDNLVKAANALRVFPCAPSAFLPGRRAKMDKQLAAQGKTRNSELATLSSGFYEITEIRKRLEAMSTDDLYAKLQEVDPVSAAQVHRNNRFRVMRAVEIFEITGKPKSEHIAAVGAMDTGLRFPKTLMFHLDSDPAVLDERLGKRIDKMVARGLKAELEEFYDQYKSRLVDHGILQSIGIKEYLPYLALSPEERKTELGEKKFAAGNAELTLHTIQYAKKQRLWFRQRFLKRKSIRELPTVLALDSSIASNFFTELVPEALKAVSTFLDNKPIDISALNPAYVSDPLASIDAETAIKEPGYAKRANAIHVCDVCEIEIHGENGWTAHLAGKKHKHFAKRRKLEQVA